MKDNGEPYITLDYIAQLILYTSFNAIGIYMYITDQTTKDYMFGHMLSNKLLTTNYNTVNISTEDQVASGPCYKDLSLIPSVVLNILW